MTESEIRSLLDRLAAAKGASLRQQRGESQNLGCCSLPRLERGAREDDWSEAERAHLVHCASCQRTLKIIRSIPDPSGSETEGAAKEVETSR